MKERLDQAQDVSRLDQTFCLIGHMLSCCSSQPGGENIVPG